MSQDLISKTSLAELNARFETYALLTSKNRKEAILHQARNFSFFLSKEMKAKAHPKGEIAGLVINRLRSGKPVRISDRARQVSASRGGSPMATEIKLRDSRRGFTVSASMFKGAKSSAESFALSNGKKRIGMLKHKETGNESGAEFEWGKRLGKWSVMAASGLGSASRRAGFEKAIRATSSDMLVYIKRKQNQIGKSIARKLL